MLEPRHHRSSSLPEQDGHVSDREVQHVLLEEADVATEVLADDAMPGLMETDVELFLERLGELKLEATFLVRLLLLEREFNGAVLHVFADVARDDRHVALGVCLR